MPGRCPAVLLLHTIDGAGAVAASPPFSDTTGALTDLPSDTVLRFAALRPDPWRNGGGITRQIADSGSHPGSSTWRLSLADVERPGPFSRFPDTDRILTVVGGEGMLLHMDGQEHTVHRGRPFRFPGDAAVTATLPGGAVRALNVMTHRAAASADVVVQELSDRRTHRVVPHSFAVLLAGHALVRTGATASELRVYDTVRGTEPDTPLLTGDGLLAVVSLDHRA